MEFKEKLQILRTQMRMSQEELAARLSISRQSVTKWENGQSFPDIQNLIQLSDIFKVTIDRLVKDNDTCNLNIFSQQQFANQDMRMFLVRAKTALIFQAIIFVYPQNRTLTIIVIQKGTIPTQTLIWVIHISRERKLFV